MAGLWPAGWAPPGNPSVAAGGTASPLILTVALPEALQRLADVARGQSAPGAALRAPAHLTLFRHLPGLQQQALVADIRAVLVGQQAPRLLLDPPARWGELWVARARSSQLDALREGLAQRWHGLLSAGDIAPPRLHISLGTGQQPPQPLPSGPWQARGLLLWAHNGLAEMENGSARAPKGERDGAFWTPLVACAFRG